jgi:hypothetical protein
MATLTLDDPAALFEFVRDRAVIDLNTIDVTEVWALAGLAVLARLPDAPIKVNLGDNPMSRFAYALGFEEVVEGRTSTAAAEPGRTVKLTRFRGWDGYEALARRIVGLIVANEDVPEARNTLHYVLVELFRNVIQHSKDSLGGVVAAQVMNPGSTSRLVQVVVADAGLGIPEALRWEHPNLHGPEDALDKALWPHFSGTFPLGETGSAQGNAGMGLFVISEMAKLTGGRLLLASRGAALSLTSNPDDLDDNRIASVGAGVGFPGTLVAFEMALDNVHDFDGMLETIKERAPAYAEQGDPQVASLRSAAVWHTTTDRWHCRRAHAPGDRVREKHAATANSRRHAARPRLPQDRLLHAELPACFAIRNHPTRVGDEEYDLHRQCIARRTQRTRAARKLRARRLAEPGSLQRL